MTAEDIRRIAALLEQPLSEKDQDLMTFIKQKFTSELKIEAIYHPEKVVTRSDTKRVSLAPPDEQCKNNCERRRELLSTGFFSPVNKPYKSVGFLHTDNIDLFSSWLSPEDQRSLKSLWEKKFGKKPGITTTPSKFNQEKAKKVEDKAQDENIQVGPSQDTQVSKGFLHLRQYLREMAAIQNTLRSGRPLVLCLREQDTHSLHSRSSSDKLTKAEGETLNPVPLCLNEQMEPEEEARQERAFVRKHDNFSEKLRWIYRILCGISHMRNRDVKTLVPLNSSYVNIIMKDTEKTNILLKQSHSSYNPLVSRRLVALAPEDCQNITDMWETFISQDTPETKSVSGRSTGLKSAQCGPRKRTVSEETAEVPPWLTLQLEETTSHEKKQQKPDGQISMLEKAKAEFLGIQRALNYQIETDVFEKKKNREERMKTLLNALMVSKTEPILSTLLISLKSEFKEPKSTSSFWFTKLQEEALGLGGDKDSRFHDLLDKISQFQNFNHKKVPHSKEKFCLLVISLPANQLLRPALQETFLFLTTHVFQILPRHLKQWYQYLKLPFSVATEL